MVATTLKFNFILFWINTDDLRLINNIPLCIPGMKKSPSAHTCTQPGASRTRHDTHMEGEMNG
jgi:hypothetical protein